MENLLSKNLQQTYQVGTLKQPETLPDLIECVHDAKNEASNWVIAGNLSNMMFKSPWDGTVIQPKLTGWEIISQTPEHLIASVGQSELLDDVISRCERYHWYGLENLSGIPGTIGAAVVQNAGAFGSWIAQVLEGVWVWDTVQKKEMYFAKSKLKLKYRTSIFKLNPDRWVITKVLLKLHKKFTPVLNYHRVTDLIKAKGVAEQDLTSNLLREWIYELRAQTHTEARSLGSVFLNPYLSSIKLSEILSINHQIKYFKPWLDRPAIPYHYVVSSGSIIETLGWKGKQLGKAKVSDKNAVILHPLQSHQPQAATDFIDLMKRIQADINQHYGIRLEIEPRII